MSSISQLGEWIGSAARFLGPWGAFLVSFADSALVPMPQGVDALLLAQAKFSPEVAYWSACLAVLGSTLGSMALYFLGRGVGAATLARRLSPDGLARLESLVGGWGAAVLLPVAAIPLPLPMKPVVLAAGIFRMPLLSFAAAIAFARLVRYVGIVLLFRMFGDAALSYFRDNLAAAAVCGVLLVALFLAVHRLSNRWLNRVA